ncbi:thrombospondin type-1 domain-containing protein 1 isoform X1 [Takifugu flavidus]|uniref:Thrombospondin type-1 domain-containing protein 1 n=2 Tax=Takifugu flavidus TaxID=433684 RepID=A0A5C6P4E0_9TELE|nr:thrombospondin type-1 domain-containing protein 1 isoform X1 [Takifugu flavidus]XP_056910841.1 thrombospondin type-1 domain-containing protein 1 isoform X1 [Takifugu flavidus]XP_056910842.1 thrombospondin type-1 domain-containing protein 1 isoform X1 [Takifugu flavidus]TWW74664.1 Thrombospondin type-1 domain-containing protein 1 [Takifugu flavidus]
MVMPQSLSLLPFLPAFLGYAFAGLSIWPSFHDALSNVSVFVEYSTDSHGGVTSSATLSLVNMETNNTVLTRTLANNQRSGRVEFNCSCFLYAGTFRFLLRQTRITPVLRASGTRDKRTVSTSWRWSSELQVHWPTFHIAVERARNHPGSFQVWIFTNEHFQACLDIVDSPLFLEVSFLEHNQIGIDKVRAQTKHPIRPLRSQSLELPCAFPFTEKDFIRVALRSPHTEQDVKSFGAFYLSRIFSYKLLVDNSNSYRSGCEGTMTVKLIAPPCAHISGKVLLYMDPSSGQGVSSGVGAGRTAPLGSGLEEPASTPLAFNWLTQGENETEFNCSVFYPGRNKYCFHFVFNFSRSLSPAQTCLVVHRSTELWGPWQPWSLCSVSCGEGVRERVRGCLLPSGVGGVQCTGTVKEQSRCSLEDCAVSLAPSPSRAPAGITPLGVNMVVVLGISLCLAVILSTVVVTLWRRFCQTPQCSSVHRGSVHSPGGRKLSDEASICGNSLQRPSVSDGHGTLRDTGASIAQEPTPILDTLPVSQNLVTPASLEPERLSPTGQKILPTVFGYRLAQQQLKEMKKRGLKEATQMYHVSSSPVNDTLLEISASPTASPVPTPTGLVHTAQPQEVNPNPFRITALFPEPPGQTSWVKHDGLNPKTELPSGPGRSWDSTSRHNRTADWVEMVERSGLTGPRGGDPETRSSYYRNPYFRRTSSFNDPKPQLLSSGKFRERSMTQVGSRTLPDGSCWSKERWERQRCRPCAIPEDGVSEWTKFRPYKDDQVKSWTGTPSHSRLKDTGTNTTYLKHTLSDLSKEKQRSSEAGIGQGISGIGGPSTAPAGLSADAAERAEQNWNRRGPSPIHRNILARKLKAAQSSSGNKGRQRSSTFSVSTAEERKSRCRSLPMSGDGSHYRLSEAEQRMLDLDLSSAFDGE